VNDRLLGLAFLLLWAGSTLLLSSWGRLSRPSLSQRLAPFHAGTGPAVERTPQGAADGWISWWGLVTAAGDRLSALFGVTEGAGRRLARVHSDVTALAFRRRQAFATAGAALAGSLLSVAAQAAPPLAAFLVFGAATMTFLIIEQSLTSRSEKWRRSTEAEIPVAAEQLAMLMGAGASLGSALNRLAARGRGCVAADLEQVVNRIAQGLSEKEALTEWSDRCGVDAVSRLVNVLTLHSEAADLGRLVTAEARRSRRDLHRKTLEQIESRSQQVWIPVTVATLVPGAILLAVPFVAALQLFGGS
jgi:tight adherence protein C